MPWWGAVSFLIAAFLICIVCTLLPVMRRRRIPVNEEVGE
jgi:hypothetical protein